MERAPSLGWSEFATGRHAPGTGYSYFQGSADELLALIRDNWERRKPGQDRTDLDEVVIVPMPCPERFVNTTVKVVPGIDLVAKVVQRQAHEDPFVQVFARGVDPLPTKFASVVLYSKHALLENGGTRSTDCDWEIVSVQASHIENEPMSVVTMARNMLGKAGGTPVRYSSDAFAEAAYYGSQHVRRLPEE